MAENESKDIIEDRKIAYQLALKKQRKINIFLGGVAFLILAFIYILINGDKYQALLSFIGLGYHQQQGVYADCSKSENQSNPFCEKARTTQADKDWGKLTRGKGGRSYPFGLSGN